MFLKFKKNNKRDSQKIDEKKDVNNKKKFSVFYIFRVLIVLVFIIILYIVFNFVRIFNKEEVKVYEVATGEIVNVDRHKGFIYRDESVATCMSDGYINFFVTNAERVNRGAFIYAVNDAPSNIKLYELNDKDKSSIKQNIKMYNNNISDLEFSNIYLAKDGLRELINEINIVKQLEDRDIEKEISAKEKGYAKYAGLISFLIDGFETAKSDDFTEELIKGYSVSKYETQKKDVRKNDAIYKIIKSPEFVIVFDSVYDYDNYSNKDSLRIKFVYENVTANGRIDSFIGSDGKKHFKLYITEYPEKFIDKRVVDFEIENKKVHGFKIPIKSIISKDCFVIPKNIIEKDLSTDEDMCYKFVANGAKERVTFNISKEDDKYYYISIDDALSKVKYGDVLTNRYNDIYSLNEVKKLEGVYNMNKGYAVFKNIEVIDRTNEYAIIKDNTVNGVAIYDHLALNASEINEGDLIS
ncbi:MAG: hypothetical protein J6M39_01175 [Lachnospiraceae bacterium]|nr:hypothetical protein [Lachnospiraceae bacterium]